MKQSHISPAVALSVAFAVAAVALALVSAAFRGVPTTVIAPGVYHFQTDHSVASAPHIVSGA